MPAPLPCQRVWKGIGRYIPQEVPTYVGRTYLLTYRWVGTYIAVLLMMGYKISCRLAASARWAPNTCSPLCPHPKQQINQYNQAKAKTKY